MCSLLSLPAPCATASAPLSELSPSRAASVMAVMTPHLFVGHHHRTARGVGRRVGPDERPARSRGRLDSRSHPCNARRNRRIGKLGPAAGLSYRQALRRFQTSVGLSPKELARLVRVRWACIKALSLQARHGRTCPSSRVSL